MWRSTTIPMLPTEIENGAWHGAIESRDFRFYHIHVHPHQSLVSDLTRLLTAWFKSTLHGGGEGSPFLLNQTRCANIFFSMIVVIIVFSPTCRAFSWCDYVFSLEFVTQEYVHLLHLGKLQYLHRWLIVQVVSEKNIQFSIFNCGKSKQSTATALQWPKT